MSEISAQYDVVVAGGGPAGAAVATLVAQRGHRVLLGERATEPRFKVGESLMPATYPIFERLGVLDRMRESAFPAKHSVQFFGPGGRAGTPFYFSEFDPAESSQTWQVRRSEFDAMLLENAAEHGVDVRYGL
ncbi:MAG: NAD(P)/FAD-dependent oxidoreductase, partial [Thermoanaerobaculia bacterium]